MYARRYRRRGPVRKRTTRKYSKKVSTSRKFSSKVKKVINRMSENKLITNAQNLASIVPMSAAQFTNITLIPTTISSGASMNNRIGNQITLTSNKIKMYFALNAYNAGTNSWQSPVQICLWIYSFKTLNAYATQASNVQDLVSNQLFQLNNTSGGTTKTVQDLLFTTNTEYITLHKRVCFTLNTPTSAAASLGYNSDGQPYKYISLDLSKYAKKMIFNDTQPGATNRDLFMLINTYHTDGSAYADAERMASFTYVQTWKYKDM